MWHSKNIDDDYDRYESLANKAVCCFVKKCVISNKLNKKLQVTIK